MMYAFLTLDDGTQIVHSEMRSDNTVRVYVERPDAEYGFLSGSCILPQCTWREICGFTDQEIARYDGLIRSAAHTILQFARESLL